MNTKRSIFEYSASQAAQNLKQDINNYWKGILAATVFVFVIVLLFGHFCPSLLILGIPCPACGLTRAGEYLLSLQFVKAWKMNPVIYPLALFFLYFVVCRYVCGTKVRGWRWMLWLLLVLLIVVYFYRMIMYFPQKVASYGAASNPMAYEPHNLLYWISNIVGK